MRSDQVAQGFFWLNLENLQGWRQHSLFGESVPILDCLHVEFFFSLYPVWNNSCISVYVHCLLSSCCAPLWKAWVCALDNHLIGTGRLLLALPKAISSPGWASPLPSDSSHMASAPVPDLLWGPLLNSLQLMYFLYWGPKPGCNTICGLKNAE